MGEKDKVRWDALVQPIDYEIGDMVMVSHEGKFDLEPNYKGPYIITQVIDGYGTCQLETIQGEPLKSLIHKDRLKPAKGPKPTEEWYNPTTSRAVVKQITSTHSGRGGEGHHVVVQNLKSQDHVDPITTSAPPKTRNDATAQNQSLVIDVSNDKPAVVNQQADISRPTGYSKKQDDQGKRFEAMEASNRDCVVDLSKDTNQDSVKQYDPLSSSYKPDEEKESIADNEFQHILDGYDSISSGDNIIDEHISETSSQDQDSAHSSPKVVARGRETTEDRSSHIQKAPEEVPGEKRTILQVTTPSHEELATPGSPSSTKMQTSAEFLQQKLAKKRVTPTSVKPTKPIQVAVPISDLQTIQT
ncbi:hypothetical protein INT47_005390 [Mucor saturninus]|uniref:Uncharacterized protein n=1 Tax=Mucor saturninus TaxID=64648 RepID=A0A8H7QVT4_9FUNG|nr:hypothetical protein INT47_005390 [Mucor saturninus]